ncbi:MAG: hypothetical protein MZW92_06885 [Comamonadaceae bacterium]|nr:hypothetical protein [Comamonadaceae bacterium]
MFGDFCEPAAARRGPPHDRSRIGARQCRAWLFAEVAVIHCSAIRNWLSLVLVRAPSAAPFDSLRFRCIRVFGSLLPRLPDLTSTARVAGRDAS